jgi:acid phosphatase
VGFACLELEVTMPFPPIELARSSIDPLRRKRRASEPFTGAYIAGAVLALILAQPALTNVTSAEPAIDALATQPPNLDELKARVTEYEKSGDYDRALATVAEKAQAYIEQHAGEVAHPALVLDIDETSLSNWPRIIANDYGYFRDGTCSYPPHGPCGARAWEGMARAKAIAPTLALFNAALKKQVSVFFITTRDESERAITERNLRAAGYHDWTALIMKAKGVKIHSAQDVKAPARAKITADGYTILANVGDQPSDLAGGNPDDPNRQFLLPNPFYRVL